MKTKVYCYTSHRDPDWKYTAIAIAENGKVLYTRVGVSKEHCKHLLGFGDQKMDWWDENNYEYLYVPSPYTDLNVQLACKKGEIEV